MQTPSASTREDRAYCDNDCHTAPQGQGDAPEALYALVAKQPFFKGLNEQHLWRLANSAMRTQFDAGQLVLEKGNPANRFYLILKGSVVLQTTDEQGATHQLQKVSAGDVLGWSWLFPPYYWHFDGVATEPTDAIFFYGSRLREQCQEHPAFGYEIMKRISEVVVARLQATRKEWVAAK